MPDDKQKGLAVLLMAKPKPATEMETDTNPESSYTSLESGISKFMMELDDRSPEELQLALDLVSELHIALESKIAESDMQGDMPEMSEIV